MLDVSEAGSIIFNLPGRGRRKITVPNISNAKTDATFSKLETKLLDEMDRRAVIQLDTCVKDVQARREDVTLENIGKMMALTRERVRQLETSGKSKSHDSDELKEERELRGLPKRGGHRGSGKDEPE